MTPNQSLRGRKDCFSRAHAEWHVSNTIVRPSILRGGKRVETERTATPSSARRTIRPVESTLVQLVSIAKMVQTVVFYIPNRVTEHVQTTPDAAPGNVPTGIRVDGQKNVPMLDRVPNSPVRLSIRRTGSRVH